LTGGSLKYKAAEAEYKRLIGEEIQLGRADKVFPET
jgi:hypothetical protein